MEDKTLFGMVLIFAFAVVFLAMIIYFKDMNKELNTQNGTTTFVRDENGRIESIVTR